MANTREKAYARVSVSVCLFSLSLHFALPFFSLKILRGEAKGRGAAPLTTPAAGETRGDRGARYARERSGSGRGMGTNAEGPGARLRGGVPCTPV